MRRRASSELLGILRRGVREIVFAKMVMRRLLLPRKLSAFSFFRTSAQTRPQIAKHAYAIDQGWGPHINNRVMCGFLCAGDTVPQICKIRPRDVLQRLDCNNGGSTGRPLSIRRRYAGRGRGRVRQSELVHNTMAADLQIGQHRMSRSPGGTWQETRSNDCVSSSERTLLWSSWP